METPRINHLNATDYDYVYEPAEDSFFLLDSLEADLPYLEQLKPIVCLEIGSGSGVIITALANKLTGALCLATDINSRACDATKRTANHNTARVECIRCNLVDALLSRSVDLLLFNPPYVVTSDEELQLQQFSDCAKDAEAHTQRNLVYSWSGGLNGRRIIDELLSKLDTILSSNGVMYLLLLRENGPEQIIEQLSNLNFEAKKFMERRIPSEYLYILKVTRQRQ